MTAFDLTSVRIGDVVTSGKTKTAPVTGSGGQAVAANMDAMQVCFEPSAFQDDQATRVNLVLRPDEATVSSLDAVDEWIVAAVTKDSLRLLGKSKTQEQVQELYLPIVKRSGKYPPQIRAKMNSSKPRCVNVWNSEGVQQELPFSWTGLVVKPRLQFRSLYFATGQFGVVLECSDLMLLEQTTVAATCPFD